MKRKTFSRIVGVGVLGTAVALLHPTPRQTMIRFQTRTLVALGAPRTSKAHRESVRHIFNFSSKAEEKAVIYELKQIAQKKWIKSGKYFPGTITSSELMSVMDKIEKKRLAYARDLLKNVDKEVRKMRAVQLAHFFEENRKKTRIPAEKEIRNIVEGKREYIFD